LLHGHSFSSLLPDVTKEAHFSAAICSGQTGSVAAFHVDAPSTAFGFAIRPSDFFGLERWNCLKLEHQCMLPGEQPWSVPYTQKSSNISSLDSIKNTKKLKTKS
jgi:hypothetical protein